MQNIIIRTRSRLFIIVAITLLAAASFFAWLYIDRIKHQTQAVDFVRSIYFGLCIGFVLGFIRTLMMAFSKKPAMAIVEQGIIDYVNLDGAQIPWENVLRAEVLQMGVQQNMAVFVNNNDELVNRLKKIKHRVAVAKINKTGTPILLSTKFYDYNVQEVVDLINAKAKAKI